MREVRDPEVLVVGGGPAGTATALALAARGLDAVVLERSRYEAVRVGETVPPGILAPLTELGVREKFLRAGHCPSHANLSAWGSSEVQSHDFLFNPYGMGWHLDRNRFDAMLAEHAEEAGARVLRQAHVRSVARSGELWRVEARRGGRPFSLRARYLVDATGRSSTLIRHLGGRRHRLDRLVGLTAYLDPRPGAAGLSATVLVEAVENGWWYSAPLPGGRVAAAFLTDAGLFPSPPGLPLWRQCLEAALHTRSRLRGCAPPAGLVLRPADSSFSETPSLPRFLAVGDAALAFDPLSSQGILKALRSGLAAAAAIARDREGRRGVLAEHADQDRRELRRYLDLWRGYYRQENRWPDSPFWKPRHGAPSSIGSQRLQFPASPHHSSE